VSKRHQVAIVGGGPVGVALAVDLGLQGIDCALVEPRTALQQIPKGQNLMQRTLEHFYVWGLAEELRAARVMPREFPIQEITAYDNMMSPYWQAPTGREQVRSYYFQATDRLPQYRTEMVLRNRLTTLPNVATRFGWSAKSVEQDADGVRVAIEEVNGGGRETLEADYVVGCDGGHSMVRGAVGIERGGTDFDQLMVLLVFRSRELHQRFAERFPPASIFRAMHPALNGYWKFFGRVDVGEEFFFHAPVPADTTRDNFDFLGLLHDAAGFKFKVEFDHVGFWDLRVAVADRYQVGRVLIAGDAAHSHPPYGSFGLNNGLEDAVNLGWKLAARIKGWGGDKLLASYSDERRPVFKETGEDFIAARIKRDAEFLTRYHPSRDRAEFEKAWDARQTEGGTRAQIYEPNYEGSPVIAGPPGGKSSAHGVHAFKARAGHHLAPQKLSSGRNVFDELGREFALIALDAADGDVAAFERAAAALGIPLKVIRDSDRDGRTAYEARLILVRPDQYVVWTRDHAPTSAEALMRKVSGRD
jgi:2-polyprenyl-6-methoxyphenol hydroxylase-like FAD-dependent oxidoreductase